MASFEQVLAFSYSISDSCIENNKFKKLSEGFSGGLIIGKIDESIKDYSGNGVRSKPMPYIQVKAQQIGEEHRVFYGLTNENGYYEIEVPVGKYAVTLIDSNLYYGEPSQNELIELSNKQFKLKDFYVVNDSRIIGKVIDSEGNPVMDISIELIPIGKNREDENFDYGLSYNENDGTFVFSGLSLGRYQISLNYIDNPDDYSPYPTFFYPNTTNRNEAQVIDIKYGTKIKDLLFQLPPKLKKRKITGQVFWKNGEPAKNAEVQLKDVEFDNDVFSYSNRIETNDKGEFELEWFEERNYKIEVRVLEKASNGEFSFVIAEAESDTFRLDEKTPGFKLVLNEKSESEKSYFRRIGRSN
jgi:hypothetical protein